MTELLKRLMYASGVPGREDKIREAIKKEVEPYADEITVDPVGNLIARKKGNGKKIMLCAHMDEIGFFATFIDDSGFIKVSPVGGINATACAFGEVVSENGVRGVIIPEGTDKPKVENMFIDIGAKTKKQAEKKVKVGDYFVAAPNFKRLMGNRYIGRPFDDRVGCAILVEALKSVKKTDNDLYFVFSTQEEVGSRGSKPASYSIAPDIGLAFDVTGTGDVPGAKAMACKLGGGAAVKIKDSSVICHTGLVETLCALAEENKIPYQREILLYGGTDTSSMQLAGGGTRAGALSIPTRYIHSGVETCDLSDVKACADLATAFVKSEK